MFEEILNIHFKIKKWDLSVAVLLVLFNLSDSYNRNLEMNLKLGRKVYNQINKMKNKRNLSKLKWKNQISKITKLKNNHKKICWKSLKWNYNFNHMIFISHLPHIVPHKYKLI